MAAKDFITAGVKSFTCMLCEDFTRPKESTLIKHVTEVHLGHVHMYNGEPMYLCKKLCCKGSHYHCICGCQKIFGKKGRLESHLNSKKCKTNAAGVHGVHVGKPVPGSTLPEELPSVDRSDSGVGESDIQFHVEKVDIPEQDVGKVKVKCPQCDIFMLNKNLKVHISRKHVSTTDVNFKRLEGSCVDELNGIFLVSENSKGVHYPVHVQKYIVGNRQPEVFCESTRCQYQKIIAGVSGNPSFECEHLLSVPYFGPFKSVLLDEAVLDILVEEKRIDPDTKAKCLMLKREADARNFPLVNAMMHNDSSNRYIFISVWVGSVSSYYSRLGRIVLTFDRKTFDLVCRCSGSSRIRCAHKPIAKWFLRTSYPDIFLQPNDNNVTTSITLNESNGKVVEYQFENKLIPCEIPDNYKLEKSVEIVVPTEDNCFLCKGPLLLRECKDRAKLLTRFGVVKLTNVWLKYCDTCLMEYHHCDINEGFLNFDNKFFMSVYWLIWTRNALLEHTALSRTIKVIEKQFKENINHDLFRGCFYKFLALTDDAGLFKCFLCGDHPVILTFDVNRKCAFKIENTTTSTTINELVDGKKFWDDVRKMAISSSFGETNSFVPSLDYWAPYIAQQCRKDEVYNTEFCKGVKDDDEESFLQCLSEESLESLLDTDVSTLRELCRQCGIPDSSKRSKISCITMLKSTLKSRGSIDKFFFKVWHSSGGLLTGTCPHGIVYAMKFLLKPESPRDIGDILLSMKHAPTVVISDIPHMLAAHVNKRSANFFNPYAGRVVEPTEENMKLAEDGNLKAVSFPWLNRRMEKATPDLVLDGMSIHPITLVSQRLSLYDKFHERNTSQRKEKLRRTGYVKELHGVVTETAEQLNSFLSSNLYFLDSLSPLHHLIVVKALLSLRNKEINAKIVKDRPYQFDIYGRAMYSSFLPSDEIQPLPFQNSQNLKNQEDMALHLSHGKLQQQPSNRNIASVVDEVITIDFQKHSKRRLKDDVDHSDQCNKFPKIIEECSLSDDEITILQSLYKGLYNPVNNCWFNAVMVAISNTLGASRLYEDYFHFNVQEYDEYSRTFKPVFESLSLRSTDLLDSDTLIGCLNSYFGDLINIGREQDPFPFLLTSATNIDSNSEYIFHCSDFFHIELKSNIVCLNCSHSSSNTKYERCLSLGLEAGIATDLSYLLDKYFVDADLDGFYCGKCRKRCSAESIKIVNSPTVLAIHLKRYDANFNKSVEFVQPNHVINMSKHMDGKEVGYKLRTVITHKGSNMNTGHFTTTIFEETEGKCVEVDGPIVKLSAPTHDINTGGYIFLYEKEAAIDPLVEWWCNLSFLMASLVQLFTVHNCTLKDVSLQLWDHLRPSTESLAISSVLLKAIASKMSRSYSQSVNSCSTVDNVNYMLKILGARENQVESYFMQSFNCGTCKLHQKHFAHFKSITCSNYSLTSILQTVSSSFEDRECYECEAFLDLDENLEPVFLSEFMLVSTLDNIFSSLTLDGDNDHSMSVVNNYHLEAALVDNGTAICKSGKFFQAFGTSMLQVSDSYPILPGEKVVLLKGNLVDVTYEIFLTNANAVINKDYQRCITSDQLMLDTCLGNFCSNVEVVQNVLYGNNLTSEFCKHFFDVFQSVMYTSFQSSDDFNNLSIGSVLSLLTLKKSHKFILIDVKDVLCLMDLHNRTLYCIGDVLDATVRKIICVCEVMFSHNARYELVRIPVSEAWIRVHYLKIVSCIITDQDLQVEEGEYIHIAMTLLSLKMLPSAIPSLDKVLKSKCAFIDSIPITPPAALQNVFLSDQGNLFQKAVSINTVVQDLKERYLNHEIGVLREDLCVHVLDFIMKERDIVEGYYFLKEEVVNSEDLQRIKNVLASKKYRDMLNRIDLLMRCEKRMLKCVPVMLYRCCQEALKYLLIDDSTKFPVNNTVVSSFKTFSVMDFLDVIIVKLVVSRFVSGRSECSYVVAELGPLGCE